jgi:hypothetical protein
MQSSFEEVVVIHISNMLRDESGRFVKNLIIHMSSPAENSAPVELWSGLGSPISFISSVAPRMSQSLQGFRM